MINTINKDIIKKYILNKEIIEKIIYLGEVDSTNNYAKKYAKENELKEVFERVFIAESQTAGRGRMGREFFSPSGSGLYMSFLLSPEVAPEGIVSLTTASSVAVARAIEKATGIRTKIKWVNDIYLDNKKVCGILAESVIEKDKPLSVVIGIGINVSTEKFMSSAGENAGSLNKDFDVDTKSRIAAEVINEIKRILCENIIENKNYDYITEYKEHSMVLGKNIRILNTGEMGYALDIDRSGGLKVKLNDGEIKTLRSGEISIRTID